MQSINTNLDDITKDLDAILKELPEERRKLHHELAEMIKKEVDTQIVAAGVNDSQGNIRKWQESHVGSRGGYAAVRASDKSTGDNSPGAITNYLTSGHKIRPASGKAKRYKPKIKKAYVDGRHFYQAAQKSVDAKAIQIVSKFADELAARLEGGGK